MKFHFFLPVFIDGTPSINHVVIVCYGIHKHPPPPAHRIPSNIKEDVIEVVRRFGTGEATARRLLSSPLLQMMLNGRGSLSSYHVTLQNMDAIASLIKKE